jgi:hypothetical protein
MSSPSRLMQPRKARLLSETEATRAINAGAPYSPWGVEGGFSGIRGGLVTMASYLWWNQIPPAEGCGRKERTMHKMRRARRVEQPPFGAQVAFARVATGLAWTGLGALAVGASAAGAMAIGALAIRALAVKRGRIQRLDIEELEVGRLHVRELVVEQEQKPVVERE